MLKKPSRNSPEVNDVPADDPVGTMDRFADGLKRVLTVPKSRVISSKKPKRRRPRNST